MEKLFCIVGQVVDVKVLRRDSESVALSVTAAATHPIPELRGPHGRGSEDSISLRRELAPTVSSNCGYLYMIKLPQISARFSKEFNLKMASQGGRSL